MHDPTIKAGVLFTISFPMTHSYFPFQVLIFTRKCRVRESIVHSAWWCWLWRMMLLVWNNSSARLTRRSRSIPRLLLHQKRCTRGSSRDAYAQRIMGKSKHTCEMIRQFDISCFMTSGNLTNFLVAFEALITNLLVSLRGNLPLRSCASPNVPVENVSAKYTSKVFIFQTWQYYIWNYSARRALSKS